MPFKKSLTVFALTFACVISPTSAQTMMRDRTIKPRDTATRDVTATYKPQPWTPGQSQLPRNYQGMDIKWLFQLLSKYSEGLLKSDFETAKEYEDRIKSNSTLPLPLAADKEYAFRIEELESGHQLRYDAETEEFKTGQFGMICLDADEKSAARPSFVVCDVGALNRSKSEYVGSNAFGATRDIHRSREHSFGLAIGKEDDFSKQFLRGYRGFQDSFVMPRARAKMLDGKRIGVLFVGLIQDPHLLTGQPTIITPTISDPTDIRVTRTAVKFRPTRVVYFVIETGEILFERPL